MDGETIVFLVVSLVFSIILHEVAHGYAAYRLGDPTAAFSNRLTLNPISHIDLFGSILLPLILIITHSPVLLGWAKPVPINPYNFRNYKRGVMITAAAGPLTNFSLALIGALLFHGVAMLGTHLAMVICKFLVFFCMTNVTLGVFNLIPIPPLDGSRVLYGLLPGRWAEEYLSIERYGMFILFGLLWLGVLDGILYPISRFMMSVLLGQSL
ncbi:MAG: site-2 protease family protein [bacterium]